MSTEAAEESRSAAKGVAAPVYDIAGLSVRKGDADKGFRLEVERLVIPTGARLALAGPSGCGKSSLIDVLAFLAQPLSVARFLFEPGRGERHDLSRNVGGRDSSFLAALRSRHIGYVPQVGGLVPSLTVRQNIDLPRRLLGLRDDGSVDALMRPLDLIRHARKKPSALSVGERQRCAIARALAHRPAVVIADEPTAALDPFNSDQVMEIFGEMVARCGSTLMVVSHDVDRVLRFGLELVPHRFRRDGDRMVSVFGG